MPCVFVCVYYLQPGVDLNGLDALHQAFVHFGPMTIVKPKSQNPEQWKTGQELK